MMSRSNSARAPKTWSANLPPEVVVSMFSRKLLKLTTVGGNKEGLSGGHF